MSAWVLPDHIADGFLPGRATSNSARPADVARCYGYELVMPPMLEHLESLLSGTGQGTLDLRRSSWWTNCRVACWGASGLHPGRAHRSPTFSTAGVARLLLLARCCIPAPTAPTATREPLAIWAEIYGHNGPEADLEILTLALDVPSGCACTVEPRDWAMPYRAVRCWLMPSSNRRSGTGAGALAAKDASEVPSRCSSTRLPPAQSLLTLLQFMAMPPCCKKRTALPDIGRCAWRWMRQVGWH